MPGNVGSVSVEVVPSTRRFWDDFRRQTRAGGNEVGDELGRVIGNQIRDHVGRGVTEGLRRSSPQIRAQGAKQGSEFGDEFSRKVRTRIDAALRSLPRATINADTSPASREVELLRRKLLVEKVKLRAGLDDEAALAKIKEIQAQLERLSKESPDVRVRVNTKAASAEIAKLRGELGLLDAQGAVALANLDKGARAARSGGFKPLLDTALLLGPALIPLAGAAVFGLGALAAAAGAGAIAVLGINTEIKAGTPLGVRYNTMLLGVKNNFAELKHTGAQAVLASFRSGFGSVQALLPGLNNDVRQFATYAGQIADHVLVGLISGLHAVNPLLTRFGRGAVDASIGFQRWAGGGGITNFVNYVERELPIIQHGFEGFGRAIAKLFEALATAGTAGLTVISLLSKVINALPLPALQAFIAGLLAARLAFILLGVASRVAGISLIATPFGAALVGVAALTVGLAAASGGFDKLADKIRNFGSANIVLNGQLQGFLDPSKQRKYGTGDYFADVYQGLTDVTNFNFKNLLGPSKRQKLIDEANANAAIMAKDLTIIVGAAARRAAPVAQANIDKAFKGLDFAHGLQTSQSSLTAVTGNVQTLLDNAQALDGVGTGAQTVINGISYATNEFNKALEATNGNFPKALELLTANKVAASAYGNQLGILTEEQTRFTNAVALAQARTGLTADQVLNYGNLLGVTGDELASGAVTADQFAAAIARIQAGNAIASASTGLLISALDTFSKSAGTAADRAALIGATLKASQGDLLGYANSMVSAATANQNLVTSFDKAQRSTVNWKTGIIDFHNAAAGPLLANLAALQDAAGAAASATYQHEVATLHLGSSLANAKQAAKDAASVFKNDTYNALIADAKQLGITRGEAQKLADRYFHMPKTASTTVEAIGIAKLTDALTAVGKQLSYLTGVPWTIDVDPSKAQAKLNIFQRNANNKRIALDLQINTGQAYSQLAVFQANATNKRIALGAGKATGGIITGPGTSTSDSIPAWLSTGEFVVNAASTSRHRALLEHINAAHFEGGGFVGLTPSANITDPQKAAKAAADKAARAAKSLGKTQATVRIRIDNTDLARLIGALQSSAASLASAGRSLLTDVAKAGGTTALVAHLRGEDNQLNALATHRASVAVKLASASAKLTSILKAYHDEASTIATAIRGGFSISGSGEGFASVESIIADLREQAAAARTFGNELTTLGRRGLNKGLIKSLAEAGAVGGGTNAAVLAQASPAQIHAINASYAALSASANRTGSQVAGTLYSAGIAAARGLVAGLRHQESALTAAMRHLADVMVTEVKRALRIKSPSGVMADLGAHTGRGFALGIAAQSGHVANASSLLARKALPSVNLPATHLGSAGPDSMAISGTVTVIDKFGKARLDGAIHGLSNHLTYGRA